ncbi:MAG: phosphoribosylformylglycinamidine cyclo-ligase [Candidatus Zixiibacteriota bacterium]
MDKPPRRKGITYAEAGVDIKAGDQAVERIKALARKTFNSQVLSEIGSFGGFFRPDFKGLKSPVLIASADGVGTKLKLAFMTGKHDTVGEDLVNHCVNDILVHGARPLFFLDYIATGKLRPDVIADIVAGFSHGCQKVGMALLGGETAEMPDFYAPGEYDLAGFIVGAVDEHHIVNGSSIRVGDICIGLASNGLHTNGYSLARKVVFDIAGLEPGDLLPDSNMTIEHALMQVHRCYAPVIHPLLKDHQIKGMAHITGGGIPGNLNRILPDRLSARIRRHVMPIPPIFDFLQKEGEIDDEEMYRAFNMGVGYIIVVAPEAVGPVIDRLAEQGERGYEIGEIIKGDHKVVLV